MPNLPHIHTQTSVGVKTRYRYQPPEKYRVIFWNDDVTTFDFVIQTLVDIFNYNLDDAVQKACEVHTQGKGPVGTYVKSIAEAKQEATIRAAREQNFPLKVTLEHLA